MYKKRYQYIAAILASVIAILIIRFPVYYYACGLSENPHTQNAKYFAGLYDIQLAIYSGAKVSEESKQIIDKVMPEIYTDDVRAQFTVSYVRPKIKRDGNDVPVYIFDELTVKKFLFLYIDMFIHNPVKIAKSVLGRTRAYWSFTSNGEIECVNYIGLIDRVGNTFPYSEEEIPSLKITRENKTMLKILKNYINFVEKHLSFVVWRFGIWTALLIFSLCVAVAVGKYKLAFLYVPVFCYIGTIILSSAWTDYRYGLSVFLIGLFLPLITLQESIFNVESKIIQN
jgi:hypothetical protein